MYRINLNIIYYNNLCIWINAKRIHKTGESIAFHFIFLFIVQRITGAEITFSYLNVPLFAILE